MPAHILDNRGTARYEKKRIWMTRDDQCATCSTPLSKEERGKQVRRCKKCRLASPGRPVKAIVRPLNNQSVVTKPKRVVEPDGETWWMQPEFQDREKFYAEAQRRHPRPGGFTV